MVKDSAMEPVNSEDSSKTLLGFWLYLMTDVVLFGALFATYVVLRDNTYDGPSGKDLFDLPFVLIETVLLLTSSFVMGLAVLALNRRNIKLAVTGLLAVFLLGAAFLGMELYEFRAMIAEGAGWWRSGFLSIFFTLIGTHGIHILFGLVWVVALIWQLLRRGLIPSSTRRMALLSMYWHFLDVIWIFIFTVVYLTGGI